MTLVALGSVAGSPGVTSIAIALAAAWPEPERRRVLIEADPDGGRLGAGLGVGAEPGLMAVALATRSPGLTAEDVIERGAAEVGDWYVVPSPPSSEQAHSVLVHAGATLARVVATDPTGSVWIVDAGRLSTRSPALPFATEADRVVLVTGGSFPILQLVPHRVDVLRSAGCQLTLVVVEPTSWTAEEIADFTGADVAAVMPRVKGRAGDLTALRGGEWRTWWRHIDALGGHLASVTATPPQQRDERHHLIDLGSGAP